MRKNVKAVILTTIILFGTAISLAFILPYFKEQPTINKGYVRLYVNSTIHDQIYNELIQYKQDIINQGYSAEIITWSNNNVTVLKNDLINASLQHNDLKGAVLIGELPIALFDYNMGTIFACDLYLMDLDGDWLDVYPPPPLNDKILDYHGDGTGDKYPEIWVGRINPECISGINYTKAYKDYFARNHAYRIGSLFRPHKALLYIDDSWSYWWSEYLSNFTAYSNIDCYYHNSTTTPANYKNNLTQNYEFVQVLVHSDPSDHYFGIGNPPSEGYVNYMEIQMLNTQPLFYNLYACSACNLLVNDNLGNHYLFSNNTLTVIGSTKTGGMNMYQSFYDDLDSGKNFGESFRRWFWDPTYGPYGLSYYYSLSMGMVILGDPLLTI